MSNWSASECSANTNAFCPGKQLDAKLTGKDSVTLVAADEGAVSDKRRSQDDVSSDTLLWPIISRPPWKSLINTPLLAVFVSPRPDDTAAFVGMHLLSLSFVFAQII